MHLHIAQLHPHFAIEKDAPNSVSRTGHAVKLKPGVRKINWFNGRFALL
jgi:hypothetical protein